MFRIRGIQHEKVKVRISEPLMRVVNKTFSYIFNNNLVDVSFSLIFFFFPES